MSSSNSAPPQETGREAQLRRKILAIHADSTLTPMQKAHLVQSLITSGNSAGPEDSQNSNYAGSAHRNGPGSSNQRPGEGYAPKGPAQKVVRFQNEAEGIWGCRHYQAKCLQLAECCQEWVSCRVCHDEEQERRQQSNPAAAAAAKSHQMDRYATRYIVCMACWTVQAAAQTCANPQCGIQMSSYYCPICHLWESKPDKHIYHCPDCKICRIGKGLGIDYYHCATCNVCMAMSRKDDHQCIERALDSECPICRENMFASRETVIFLRCGHGIHEECEKANSRHSFQCPVCLKSVADMTLQWAQVEQFLRENPTPQEYRDRVSTVLCNDCEKRTQAPFHFVYHKCADCGSYNTSVVSVHIPSSE